MSMYFPHSANKQLCGLVKHFSLKLIFLTNSDSKIKVHINVYTGYWIPWLHEHVSNFPNQLQFYCRDVTWVLGRLSLPVVWLFVQEFVLANNK